MIHNPPVLVTLTGPTCAGKSHLLNYIRDEAKLPCLISTTTRAPRFGEVQGVDYYFVSESQSRRIEQEGGFVELATYGGARYGITWVEWTSKLRPGEVAFLIVEPAGIDNYAEPVTDAGAIWLKYYVHADPSARHERLKARVIKDLDQTLAGAGNKLPEVSRIVSSALDRLQVMLTTELQWWSAKNWTRVLFGTEAPAVNLNIIRRDVEKARRRAS